MLQSQGVNCIVDVRSIPASKYAPQFNMEALRWFLKGHGIQYLHFGEEFGARRSDSIVDGQVNFEVAVTTAMFLSGVERLKRGLDIPYTISLMCSEANPIECHRFSLVSRFLYDQGVDVQHILKDATVVSHKQLEEQMIDEYRHSRKYHLSDIDQLFGTYTTEEQRRDAYRIKNKEIGYRPQYEYVEKI